MTDPYWDTNDHFIGTKRPHEGKNYTGNFQDVSSIVSGQVLYDINHNFCQSWDRPSNIMYSSSTDSNVQLAYEEKLSTNLKRQQARQAYSPKDKLGEEVMAQILRTYDTPEVEDIQAMYLQNITKVSSYIYTENQYFRWGKLVQTFIEHWQKMKQYHRTQPIHWFVVTNSSDSGIGGGIKSSYEMFNLLGRRDVMPVVAKEFDKELPLDTRAFKQRDKQINRLEAKIKRYEKHGLQGFEQAEDLKQEMAELKAQQEKDAKDIMREAKKLKQDLSDEIGIKVHICTLVAQVPPHLDNPDTPIEDYWREVYVHSKCTMMDDTFLFIGSANINERSMKTDTELGIISECAKVTKQLRKDLWQLHLKEVNTEANPNQLNNPTNAQKAFKIWEELLKINTEHRDKQLTPIRPLCEFLRLSPKITNLD
ncbi:phospholipase D-like domain-containing protein [Conservatibacter flavescens]|uniref:PLD phosphodiesterase domain-containing protein n=1 Tax=Conservatibacter flavescens TaxID=28161 RepID=A0A2M8S3G0_9PAST|nr:phospholipase D-like domain-containing protein [Conservatibacter flavescens]PJG85637.1 hypothetical protein CVP05_05610 [Conservatibacter flavescens]